MSDLKSRRPWSRSPIAMTSRHESSELRFKLRRSARKWKILRVSWRMWNPASMISRAKSGSSNHRGAGRDSREHLASAPEQNGGRAAIVAGLSRYAGRELQAHPDDGMEA